MKADMSVARVVRYGSSDIGKAERHNERKNESYDNMNVDTERTGFNVHFKDPGEKSYYGILKEKEMAGEVSTRGLKADATLFDEMIIDVNTMYFERHGGYDYAKEFYEEAFHFAEKKFGSENIISAVMHADEINQAATEECGHPVYHYHLHVMALPVVEKKILWSKRCRDENLRGTVREVINQISHSKKWESKTPALDEDGNPLLRSNGSPKYIKSYSLLQDELFEHMQEAGFRDFERGERGSTAEHLECTQFKIKKDLERLEGIEAKIEDAKIDYKKHKSVFKSYSEIEHAGKTGITGKVSMSQEDFSKLSNLAKEGLTSRDKISDLKSSLESMEDSYRSLSRRYRTLDESFDRLQEKFDALTEKCRPFLDALKEFPDRAKVFIKDVHDLSVRKREREERQQKERELQRMLKRKMRSRDDMCR